MPLQMLLFVFSLPGYTQTIEVAFSPESGAEALVIKAIRSAKTDIRLAAYSFTSPAIVATLIDAKRHGVDVRVVVDEKDNIHHARGNAALNLLVDAGIPARTISKYAIHHDKYIIVDGQTVETGSFNYTQSAAKRNSENVVVIWNNKKIAADYVIHWQSRYDQGIEYKPKY